MYNYIASKKVKIRKSHHCWGCTKEYQPPYEMERVTQSDDSKIYSIYWCEDCQKILKENFYDGDTFTYGELVEIYQRLKRSHFETEGD